MQKTWYCWRVSKRQEFITPWDNREDDSLFNKFDTPEQARENLEMMISKATADEQKWLRKWILCKMTLEPLEAEDKETQHD